jgi:brefeldin A-resistance guanine nucleotide exchange factor 1
MACQMRRGDLLRRLAEMTMVKLSQKVFARLGTIEPENDESLDSIENGRVKMAEPIVDDTNNGVIEDVTSKILVTHDDGDLKTDDGKFTPYGTSSIKDIFRVLISILDPANFHQYTDSTRIMALRLINMTFEVSGKTISKHPSLLSLTSTTLCKHLFQLIRLDNPVLVQAALRVILTLMHTSRTHLKMQQEFVFTYLLTCLSPIFEIPREIGVDTIFYDGVPNFPKLIKSSNHPSRTTTSTPVSGGSSQGAGRSTPKPIAASGFFKSPEVREIICVWF